MTTLDDCVAFIFTIVYLIFYFIVARRLVTILFYDSTMRRILCVNCYHYHRPYTFQILNCDGATLLLFYSGLVQYNLLVPTLRKSMIQTKKCYKKRVERVCYVYIRNIRYHDLKSNETRRLLPPLLGILSGAYIHKI